MGMFSTAPGDSKGVESNGIDGKQAGAIAAASAEVKSKRGGFRPGSGRKPGSAGLGGAKVESAAQNGKEQNQTQVSEADIEFVRTVAEAGLKMLDRIETNIILGLIKSIDDPTITEKADGFLRQREIGEGDVEVVVNACGALAAKYSVLSKYAPEAALVSWACIHGMAFHGVTSDLKKLAITVKGIKAKGVKTGDASRSSTD